jgi:hypothetical protein
VDILIRGGDAETAAQETRAALREIFEVDTTQTVAGGERVSGARSLDLALFILSIPPAVDASANLIARARLGERLRRLIAKIEHTRKKTGAKLLIDPGDGKPLPLEEAKRETILAALEAFERHQKKG